MEMAEYAGKDSINQTNNYYFSFDKVVTESVDDFVRQTKTYTSVHQ